MIRLAKKEDLDAITAIYRTARKYMAANGNPSQWEDHYPTSKITECDLKNNNLYVIETENRVCGVFALVFGIEPNYSRIEDGTWKNDRPYATIHRLASDGTVKGIFKTCIDFCKSKTVNLRIDTHSDNYPMLHLIEKNGFERCGTIYVEDGTPRIAFQYTKVKHQVHTGRN